MNGQNILNYYGTKLDIRIDNSEYYDYEIAKNDTDYSTDILDITKPILYSSLLFDSWYCYNIPINQKIPLEFFINTGITTDNCNFTIQRRTEKGWTIDVMFNRNGLDWTDNSIFYYWGIKNETNPLNYIDNNLSFGFSSNGTIQWKSFRYSGYCELPSGYTTSYYISSGETLPLCSNGTSNDFNITITFERNLYLTDCELLNNGGQNDLITGWTVTNALAVIETGATENIVIFDDLNKKWVKERDERLGTLKIYHNGNVIYKLKNWEEVIPSLRRSSNPMVQIWGSGTTGCEDLHLGHCDFIFKDIKFYEEPLDFLHIKHNYTNKKTLTYFGTFLLNEENNYFLSIENNYLLDIDNIEHKMFNINECNVDCIEEIYPSNWYFLMNENKYYLLDENNNILKK